MLVLPPFRLADGSAEAKLQTRVELAWDERGLEVIFTCEDQDAWGSFTGHDDPLWQEEAVEVFLAAGEEDPKVYYEVELSPRGVLFDAKVENPNSRREDMVVATDWDWHDIEFAAQNIGKEGSQDWQARLFLPWQGIGLNRAPPILRANFYRIERPRNGEAEFSCWSPTLKSPPDFHQPARFGTLYLEGHPRRPDPRTKKPKPPLALVPRRRA
jgi:hypothetical protein